MVTRPGILALLALLAAMPLPARAEPALRPGDRWALVGDSITHLGPYAYYITLYTLTRHPGVEVSVFNCGIGGDTAQGANGRYDWDIAPCRPTVATVMLGMNDVGRDLYLPGSESRVAERTEADRRYASEMEALVSRLRAGGARVILLSPSPFDQYARIPAVDPRTGVNDALARYGALCRDLARRRGCGYVDLNGPMTHMTLDRQLQDPGFSFAPHDRVHPSEEGHFVMAALFLEQTGAEPMVAGIALDARRARPGACVRSRVRDLRALPDGVSFSCLEEALPYPVPAPLRSAARETNFFERLDTEELRVRSLPEGSYALSIDGAPAGTFASAALAAGVNLALLEDTPQLAQARRVAATERERFDLACSLRTVALIRQFMERNGIAYDGSASADERLRTKLEELRRQGWPYISAFDRYVADYTSLKGRVPEVLRRMVELSARERAEAVPVWHAYVLTRVPPRAP